VQGVCFVSPISPVWSAVRRLIRYCQQQLTRTLLLSEQIEFCVTSVIPTVRGKAALLQAWSDPGGSRKLRFPDFMTMAWDGGKVVSLMHRPPLPPGNAPGTHFCWRLS